MGTPVPIEWPELIDDQEYEVTEDGFWWQGEGTECKKGYIDTVKCITTGEHIKWWYENVGDCVLGIPLCFAHEGDNFRTTCIEAI